jgi:hypothetical protein
MEGARRASDRIARQGDDFVVRRFSPVRIERLLLTRLIDLTTGSHVPEEPAESSRVPLARPQAVVATTRREEAA